MRDAVTVILLLALAMTSAPSALGADSVKSKVGAIPSGARMELRLKDKHKLRGFKGDVFASSFKLLDSQGGQQEVAFADVVSARAVGKSHVTRNVLIIVAAGIVAVAAVVGIEYARCGPLGCGKSKI